MQEDIRDLQDSVLAFIEVASRITLSEPVYKDGWNAKQIIAHIVFYHEYYASVVKAIAEKEELPLIDESLAKVNIRSANEYSEFSREELLSRFSKAQSTLVDNIVQIKSDGNIPYKKNGRIYKPQGYIEEIARHMKKHTKDLARKAKLDKRVRMSSI